MKRLYLRWAVLMVILGVICFLGIARYNRDVRTISPKTLVTQGLDSAVRLMGMIDAASLKGGSEGQAFRFTLSQDGTKVPVIFSGDDADTLRELKTVVVVGRWHADKGEFEGKEIALTPNYGFITSAYVLSLIPLILFLFYMERRVALLYVMIKEEKAYQAEVG